VPFLKTSYPVTATLSVAPDQVKFVVVWVVPAAVKVGAVGATVSVDPAVIVKLVFETSKKI
jgi:hypothetical protein